MLIQLPIEKLSTWQKVAFSAALIERMLPNYLMFSEACEFGEGKILRNQLDLIWQWLDPNNKIKINYEAQFIKLEEQIPDPEAFDNFGVFPAIDTCMAILSLLQTMQDQENDGADHVSLLSLNTVTYYCELEQSQLAEENESAANAEEKNEEEHPLLTWEIASQHELFDFVKNNPANKQTCQAAKALALEEGMSNLGIEI